MSTNVQFNAENCTFDKNMVLQNGSDHKVVANYSGLYEEGDVGHINVFGLGSVTGLLFRKLH